jgi:hypothetical protein
MKVPSSPPPPPTPTPNSQRGVHELRLKVESHHRVDRVLSFFSSRPNWDSPTPSPPSPVERVTPPLWFGG